MRADVQRCLVKDAAAAAAKRAAAAVLMAEVSRANDAMLARKQEAVKQEKAADAAITSYVAEREAREQVCQSVSACFRVSNLV